MSISYKLMSHRKEGQAYEDGQRLVDHLRGVSRIAEGSPPTISMEKSRKSFGLSPYAMILERRVNTFRII